MQGLPNRMKPHVPEKNAFGSHDFAFRPENPKIPLRCPACNRLMSSQFSDIKACPNCHEEYPRKKHWKDMYVEAEQIHNIHGGWDRHILDILEGEPPSVIEKDRHTTHPIHKIKKGDAAENMVKWAISQRRKQQMKQEIQSLSGVDDILHQDPTR